MSEPSYQADIGSIADELRRAHGSQALEFAVRTTREYIANSAWKNCAMWLQVVNLLNRAAAPIH